MVLLAIWQVILFSGNIDQIDQQRTVRSQQLTQRLSAAEQSLRQAPEAAVDQAWQRSCPTDSHTQTIQKD
jgi:hypothetical protein